MILADVASIDKETGFTASAVVLVTNDSIRRRKYKKPVDFVKKIEIIERLGGSGVYAYISGCKEFTGDLLTRGTDRALVDNEYGLIGCQSLRRSLGHRETHKSAITHKNCVTQSR